MSKTMMIAPKTIIQLEISYPAIDVFRLNHSIALLPDRSPSGDNNSKSGQDRPIGSGDQAAHEGRAAADRGEYRQAAGASSAFTISLR
jgi:hypothetical protein